MRERMSKPPPPAPTASAIGPCRTVIKIVGRPGTGSLPSTIAPPDFVEPACSKARHSCYYFAKVYARACVHACMRAYVRPECARVITPTFMHGFQNYLTQFLFLRRSGVI